ncbi:MAG TPA: DeoR family transcriptional regulator [Candidatus Paceibacterota bacterium]
MSFINELYIHNRSEKLVTAIFLVLKFIPDSNKLKPKIEDLALELVSSTASLKDNFSYEKSKVLSVIETILLQLSSLINISSVSGFVSEMNASVLKTEFDSLIKTVNQSVKDNDLNTRIGNNFFENKEVNTLNQVNQKYALNVPIEKSVIIKDKNTRSEAREKAIIDTVRERGEISIKDIAKNIRGCSEKTIQRNLISLIESGVLKRTGERRWSKYSIA